MPPQGLGRPFLEIINHHWVVVATQIFVYFHPENWGRFSPISTVRIIFFKWVGEKPPTRSSFAGMVGSLGWNGPLRFPRFKEHPIPPWSGFAHLPWHRYVETAGLVAMCFCLQCHDGEQQGPLHCFFTTFSWNTKWSQPSIFMVSLRKF